MRDYQGRILNFEDQEEIIIKRVNTLGRYLSEGSLRLEGKYTL